MGDVTEVVQGGVGGRESGERGGPRRDGAFRRNGV